VNTPKSIDDGGPAFPLPTPHSDEGMSLRDHFAAKAMQGLIHDILIDQHWEDFLKAKGLTTDEFPDYLGYLSYLTADAMLRQRKIGAA